MQQANQFSPLLYDLLCYTLDENYVLDEVKDLIRYCFIRSEWITADNDPNNHVQDETSEDLVLDTNFELSKCGKCLY